MRETQRTYTVLLCMLVSVFLHAQSSQYEQMVSLLNEQSLPLVNLEVDIKAVNRTNYVPGTIEIADYQRRTEEDSLTVRFLCMLKYRGESALKYEKKSFAVKLIDATGEDLDANIFGIRQENSWILDAMAIDRVRMRNRLCFDVWNDMSRTPYNTKTNNRNGTEGVFVEVFVNGEYNGLYCMTDKIDRKLLGLKKAKSGDDGDVMIRGLLYKGIGWGNGWSLKSYNADAATDKVTWNAWELQYPDDYPSIATWQPLMDLMDFCSNKTTDDEFVQSYKDWFYPDNLADYVIFTLALNVGDNLYKNTFLSTVDITQGHRYMISPWDMDMSLGGNYDGKYNEELSIVGQYNHRAPFNRLIGRNVDGFADKLTDTWKAYYTSLFAPENIGHRLDNYAAMFSKSGAWEREFSKWNGNPVPLKEHLSEETDFVKTWYARNYESLCEQFGTPLVSTDIVNPGVTSIRKGVYTLDGRKVVDGNTSRLSKGLYIVDGRKILIR